MIFAPIQTGGKLTKMFTFISAFVALPARNILFMTLKARQKRFPRVSVRFPPRRTPTLRHHINAAYKECLCTDVTLMINGSV